VAALHPKGGYLRGMQVLFPQRLTLPYTGCAHRCRTPTAQIEHGRLKERVNTPGRAERNE
jgi:hypothetical protein